MLDWLSDNRALIAAVLIPILVVAFVWSIYYGRKQGKLTENDEVFGDPVRTKGGWYWAVCGVCSLLLVWFYFSWGIGRAYFPEAANDMCQIAKLEESVGPIKASLPIGSRYYKSTLLAGRNADQLQVLQAQLPSTPFTDTEKAELGELIGQTQALIANSSDPANMSEKARSELAEIASRINDLGGFLDAGPQNMTPTAKALAQP